MPLLCLEPRNTLRFSKPPDSANQIATLELANLQTGNVAYRVQSTVHTTIVRPMCGTLRQHDHQVIQITFQADQTDQARLKLRVRAVPVADSGELSREQFAQFPKESIQEYGLGATFEVDLATAPATRLLDVQPQGALRFSQASGDTEPTATLKLANVYSGDIGFKVLTNAPRAFFVRPGSGVIRQQNQQNVQITFHPEQAPHGLQSIVIGGVNLFIKAVPVSSADHMPGENWSELPEAFVEQQQLAVTMEEEQRKAEDERCLPWATCMVKVAFCAAAMFTVGVVFLIWHMLDGAPFQAWQMLNSVCKGADTFKAMPFYIKFPTSLISTGVALLAFGPEGFSHTQQLGVIAGMKRSAISGLQLMFIVMFLHGLWSDVCKIINSVCFSSWGFFRSWHCTSVILINGSGASSFLKSLGLVLLYQKRALWVSLHTAGTGLQDPGYGAALREIWINKGALTAIYPIIACLLYAPIFCILMLTYVLPGCVLYFWLTGPLQLTIEQCVINPMVDWVVSKRMRQHDANSEPSLLTQVEVPVLPLSNVAMLLQWPDNYPKEWGSLQTFSNNITLLQSIYEKEKAVVTACGAPRAAWAQFFKIAVWMPVMYQLGASLAASLYVHHEYWDAVVLAVSERQFSAWWQTVLAHAARAWLVLLAVIF